MIVVDTHVLVWLTSGHSKMGARSRRMLDTALAEDGLAVSAISFWEVALLVLRGRLELGTSASAWRSEVLSLGVNEVAMNGEIAVASTALTGLHSNPADRIIAATAVLQGAALMTADERLLSWKNPLRRHDARR